MRGLRVRLAIALLAPALLATPAWAQRFGAEAFTLDNGMQLVVMPNHRVPAVMQMVWYRVGDADDPVGKSGLAHFLEHLMFKGTAATPRAPSPLRSPAMVGATTPLRPRITPLFTKQSRATGWSSSCGSKLTG